MTGRRAAVSSAAASSIASRRASGSLGGSPSGGRCGPTCRAFDLVARQLEIDRPLVPHRRFQHPIDLAERGLGPVQHGRGDRDLLKHLVLRLESLDLVVQERVMRPLRHSRRARQHDHRRLLGVGPGDAVAGRQPPHAIRHANAAQPVNPRVRVGREARVVFAGDADQLDRAFLDQFVQLEDVIAGDAEDMLDPQGPQPLHEVPADGHRGRGRRGCRSIAALARHDFSCRSLGRGALTWWSP